ncbi:MAG TPA: alpha/beta hydrolase [Kofleriaceae bacterium]|nr:alpha/beta hydrolase [Kofleriaceae bacterium]
MTDPRSEATEAAPGGDLAHIELGLARGTFHALAGGRGRTVLYLHGFPDHPPTARAFLGELARGHRVVAPWLRGYAPSPLAGPYDTRTLVADVAAMIEQLGAPLDVVGHDWGAAITYALCATRPELVRRAVALSVPHPQTFLSVLRTTPAQLVRSWYMVLFQLPGAGAVVSARDFTLIDRLWRAWSPGFTLPDADRQALHACLAASMPAPIEYYRAMVRPLRQFARRTRALGAVIRTPLLQLHGARDGCIRALPEDLDRHRFAAREHETIPNMGHFIPHEAPHALAARVTRWLA